MRAGIPIFLLLLMFTAHLVKAQSTPAQEHGYKPYGTFQNSAIDSVSLDSANINVHIPLWSLPQRGNLRLGGVISYSDIGYSVVETCSVQFKQSCTYRVIPNNLSTSQYISIPLGTVQIVDGSFPTVVTQTYDTGQVNSDGNHYFEQLYDLYGSDGSEHNLIWEGGSTFRAVNASGYEFISSLSDPETPANTTASYALATGTVIDSAGNQYTGSGSNSTETDVDGNEITDSSGTITDTLGRIIGGGTYSSSTTGCPSIDAPYQTLTGTTTMTIPAVDGQSETLLICEVSYQVHTQILPTHTGYYEYSATIGAIQSIVFPDGRYWGFVYDAADPNATSPVGYGDLLKILTPHRGLDFLYMEFRRRFRLRCRRRRKAAHYSADHRSIYRSKFNLDIHSIS